MPRKHFVPLADASCKIPSQIFREADNLLPMQMWLLQEAALPNLIAELQFLGDFIHHKKVNGAEG